MNKTDRHDNSADCPTKYSRLHRRHYRARRVLLSLLLLGGISTWLVINPESYEPEITGESAAASYDEAGSTNSTDNSGATNGYNATNDNSSSSSAPLAVDVLAHLETKGRAPKTGYARTEFYNTWPKVDGCSLRQKIIRREMGATAVMDGCDVIAGEYTEPYTGSYVKFYQKSDFSKKVQIDHIVALSNAWQTGAQYQDKTRRYALATDPLNLIAADSSANMTKSDGDAATWLPPNKPFRCEYVARQVAVKYKYTLWVTAAERDAIAGVLEKCPAQTAPGVELAN